MPLTIFNSVGMVKTEVSPKDTSVQAKEIQGDNVLSLSFTHYDYIELDVDDFVNFLDERYWMVEKYRPKQNARKEWVYNLKLYGIESRIKDLLVIKTVDNEDEPVFTLTAPPREHVALIVKCMNSGMGNVTDWKVGRVDGTENIVIDYFGKYCDEALREVAEKVGAEAWVEGQTVNICRCEHGEPIELGYDNGLLYVDPDTAKNAKFYTRLYPVGSSRNIDRQKYGFTRLQLPGGRKYIEVNADKYGRRDHYEDAAFAEIYPRRIGKVSNVRSEVKTGEDGNPFTIYYFKDGTLDFDPNSYEIGGMVKRVSFQEGSELAGLGQEDNGSYYFEVNFNSATSEFEIITIWPYDSDTQLPGDKLVPKIGDEYILWNISMPDEYYALAEQEFLEAVNKFNAEHALDVSVFKAPTDHVWIEDNRVELSVGQRVRLMSDQYFPETGYRDSRITKITRKVNLPSQMDIEIGDALSRTSMQKITDSITEAKSYIRSIGESISLPDIIRTGDKTKPTDTNLYSAKRTKQEFLSRLNPDTARGRKIFLDGVETGEFVSGVSGAEVDADGNAEVESVRARKDATVGRNAYVGNGLKVGKGMEVGNYVAGASGGSFWIDENGEAHIDTAFITVNKRMSVKEVEIQEQTHVGGSQIISPAAMTCCSVEELNVDGSLVGWRCYFRCQSGDGTSITNDFRRGDFARCETFNLERDSAGMLGNRYYWRRVLSTGITQDAAAGEKFGYIDLSNAPGDCDPAGADCIPTEGDRIVVVGSDITSRQNVIIISAYGEGAPYIYQYKGINTFSMGADKLKTRISPDGNRFTGTFIIEADGEEEELTSYVERRTPYSLEVNSPFVIISGGDKPVFAPARITCKVYHGAGTDNIKEIALNTSGEDASGKISLRYTVRRYDEETGNYVDDEEKPYRLYVFPSAGMRSITFRLYMDEEVIDTVSVSIQRDSTGMDAEYKAAFEVTEKRISATTEATTALDRRVGSLEITADAMVSHMGKLSRNLLTTGRWSCYPSDPLNMTEENGQLKIVIMDTPSTMLAFQCPVHIADFKEGTDYTLAFRMTIGNIFYNQVMPDNLPLRATLAKVDSTGRIAPIATSNDVSADEVAHGAQYTIHLQTFDPMQLPGAPLYLLIYMDWATSLRLLNKIVISDLKLEEGATATPYCPPGEDFESRITQTAEQIDMAVKVDGVERSGMKIDAEGITLDADKIKILTDGMLTALFSNGMINASLLAVGKLMTMIGGKCRISLSEFDDGFLRFYHDDGVTLAAKVGIEQVYTKESSIATVAAGGTELLQPFGTPRQAIIQVFDTSGKLTWLLACDTGPYTPSNQPYNWRSYSLVSENSSNTYRLRHTTETLKATEYWLFTVDKSLVQPDDKYLQYSGKLFTHKLSDAAFNDAASHYASGTLFHPSASLKPQLIGYTGPDVYQRYYYEMNSGSMGVRRTLDIN